MKKINKKGFALAEAIVVSVFVLGMFTYLAMNIIPLISKYDAVLKYDNPQEIYAANVLYDEVLNYMNTKHVEYTASNFKDMKFDKSRSLIAIDSNGENQTNGENQNYFSELIDYLGIVNTFWLDVDGKCNVTKDDYGTNYRGMRDYCNYLFSKKGLESKKKYAIFLVEFENNKFSHFVIMEGENNEKIK